MAEIYTKEVKHAEIIFCNHKTKRWTDKEGKKHGYSYLAIGVLDPETKKMVYARDYNMQAEPDYNAMSYGSFVFKVEPRNGTGQRIRVQSFKPELDPEDQESSEDSERGK